MWGETALDSGFYDFLVTIAWMIILLTLLDYVISLKVRHTKTEKCGWGLPVINLTAGFGLLAICATPWAHFNVDHPLAKPIYSVQNLIKPDIWYSSPPNIRRYAYDPDIWSCSLGPCLGEETDTQSVYTHRALEISYRYVAYYDCMTPEFNVAVRKAMELPMGERGGDMRRYERVFFDTDGRHISFGSPWIETPLLRSNLSEQERQASPMTINELMHLLAEDYEKRLVADHMAVWEGWEQIKDLILTARVVEIYQPDNLVIGLKLNNGTTLIGTQPTPGAVHSIVKSCGSACEQIRLVHQ